MFMERIFVIILIIITGCTSPNNGEGSNKTLGCTDNSACNYDSSATDNDGSCNYTDCINSACDSEVCISIKNVNHTNSSFDIFMINSLPVAGFQFELTGITITDASGGSAEIAGFMVSTSPRTVLSFSLTGSTISSGNRILTQISFIEYTNTSPLCMESPIFSDESGNPLSVQIGECYD